MVSIVLALIGTSFAAPLLYGKLFRVGGGFFLPSSYDANIMAFLLLYSLFLTFFYRAFSKNFKPINLVYFLALPFLLFISSTRHIAAFLILLAAGWLLGWLVFKFIPNTAEQRF